MWMAALAFGGLLAAQNGLVVYNKGIGGQNSEQGRARFDQDVIALKPDIVLIYFGLNDTLNEPRFVPLDRFIGNLEWMLARARDSGVRPVLCTIQHVNTERLLKRHKRESYGEEGPNGKIDRYNAAIRRLARVRQVGLADFASALDRAGGPTDTYTPDGVHLTPAGYELLAGCFFESAQPLRGNEKIVCLGDSVTAGVNVNGKGTAEGSTYPALLRNFKVSTLAR
ncbi:MAG TPA: GDSL-type esterase/lipase family protein [Bryobacteraceae bacterium]|nr:GDSL-type esterase/lipase family protein [Bryobacteraceae bacterium]